MKEIWQDIEGYEGLYQVSNLGRVKSLERSVKNNRRGGIRLIKESVLNPTDNGNGYMIVGLHKGGNRKNYYLHRLVAEYFVPNPQNKKFVNHLDYNLSNNVADNLQWCTQKENVNYSVPHMRKQRIKCTPSNTGEKYISKKGNSFRVQIKSANIYRTFKTLQEAIDFRNTKVVI